MKKIITGISLFVFILLLPGGILAQTKGVVPGKNCPTIVQNLRELLRDTPRLSEQIETALQQQEKGAAWYGKDMDYFVRFFEEWLVYNPVPADPSKYIVPFDALANSPAGDILFNNNIFSSWFIAFLDARGEYLGTEASARTMFQWMKTPEIKMSDFIVPKSGFLTFNDFFLRDLKEGARPLSGKGDPSVIVSPADGMACQIYANNLDESFKIKRDEINIRQALNNSPYAEKFVGGPVLDILLWFTDYHKFHSPVTGTMVEVKEYAGSYNYNFNDVNWYKQLAKHKRTSYIFKTENLGHVAMIPVGFWGVGSIVTDPKITPGYSIKKGEYIGRFGYGGSSILLVFEPGKINYSQCFPVFNSGDGGIPVQIKNQIGFAAK